jgi:hypothetical protein
MQPQNNKIDRPEMCAPELEESFARCAFFIVEERRKIKSIQDRIGEYERRQAELVDSYRRVKP